MGSFKLNRRARLDVKTIDSNNLLIVGKMALRTTISFCITKYHYTVSTRKTYAQHASFQTWQVFQSTPQVTVSKTEFRASPALLGQFITVFLHKRTLFNIHQHFQTLSLSNGYNSLTPSTNELIVTSQHV